MERKGYQEHKRIYTVLLLLVLAIISHIIHPIMEESMHQKSPILRFRGGSNRE